ncbi:uncharacterized protein LOC121245206 [Juglans microcarpa x Juglans regia]|uniref:uncharacterized protein LOC121245206 n=1 Tax=Juglans microcarpa x Juglans regia TaxID=2249226 RepID=UPI001B7E505D|nr:uncharacterized protein LOC121245206 [Juglans microcarpa x Juglans regia]
MEKIFRALFCTDEQKVEFATYMLADEADERRTSTRELLLLELNEGVSITWDRFKQAFLDRYFSPALREAKARQFLDLVQGTMIVERYTATFVALSRFASCLVLDEERKCEKFERGLHPRIRSHLIPLRIRNFTDLVTRATLVEENMRVNTTLFNQRKRQQPPPDSIRNKKPAPNYRPQPPLTTKSGQRTTAPARVFALTPRDTETSNDVVTGTLSLFSCHASILFDSGATHSFISNHYVPLTEKIPEPLEPSMSVATPSGEHVNCDYVLIGCPIEIQGRILPADLIIFNMSGFDVILGMDWLSRNHACVDCFNKRVVFKSTNGEEFSFQSVQGGSPPRVISAL